MEPQGRENVPARHTPERNKRLGLRKTTLASRESARSNSWAECRDTKKFRHRAEGEIFLLTFPFIGLLRVPHFIRLNALDHQLCYLRFSLAEFPLQSTWAFKRLAAVNLSP